MKIYKLNAMAEFPGINETSDSTTASITAIERIDIRPNETVILGTGLKIEYSQRVETLSVVTMLPDCQVANFSVSPASEFLISIRNTGKHNVPIHPGCLIASLTATRKMSLRAALKVVESENNANLQN